MCNIDTLRQVQKYLVVFILGFAACWIFFPRTITQNVEKEKVVTGITQTDTTTDIAYVPKKITAHADGSTSLENTDLDITIPKSQLNVKINGQSAIINKSDEEEYIFEKNKLQLQQKSVSDINIKIPTLDNTRHWSLGIGYGNNGIAGTIDFPLYKPSVSGWVYADKKSKSLGLKINF